MEIVTDSVSDVTNIEADRIRSASEFVFVIDE